MKCHIMHYLQTVKRVDEMPHNALFANSEELMKYRIMHFLQTVKN